MGKVYLWDHASDPQMKEIVQVGGPHRCLLVMVACWSGSKCCCPSQELSLQIS